MSRSKLTQARTKVAQLHCSVNEIHNTNWLTFSHMFGKFYLSLFELFNHHRRDINALFCGFEECTVIVIVCLLDTSYAVTETDNPKLIRLSADWFVWESLIFKRWQWKKKKSEKNLQLLLRVVLWSLCHCLLSCDTKCFVVVVIVIEQPLYLFWIYMSPKWKEINNNWITNDNHH